MTIITNNEINRNNENNKYVNHNNGENKMLTQITTDITNYQ